MKPLHPWPIRLSHWLNIPLLLVMAGSGLQIFMAFPSLGPRGAPYGWYPFQGHAPPSWMGIGGWLAGARHLHFAVAWLLLANAIFYLVYLFASGAVRDRYFYPRRDTGNALATFAHYLRLRPAPQQGLYNGLQRLSYSVALLLAALTVLSGIALWKPVQFSSLAWIFGGYDGARAVHLIGLVSLASFTAVHVVVVALHPRTIVEMIGGGRDDG